MTVGTKLVQSRKKSTVLVNYSDSSQIYNFNEETLLSILNRPVKFPFISIVQFIYAFRI